tara:strand:+ start:976 stop:1116 length:141 start_codon:yes stop_codon:yes gene_type:complete
MVMEPLALTTLVAEAAVVDRVILDLAQLVVRVLLFSDIKPKYLKKS